MTEIERLRELRELYWLENHFSMHPSTEREWEQILEDAAEKAAVAGATDEEIERVLNEC